MRICPRCRSEFADNALDVCPFDNWGLVSTEDYYEAEGDPLLGAVLGGRFRIVGRLGVGAMGTVYKAVQASVGRLVALKVLRPDLTKDPDTAARFHREAHATSALKHPNTVTLYDFGQTAEGYLYIAMELLEGRLLGRMLKEDGELPTEMAVRIVTQIARSLAEAHRKGIVHRDLKPDNIILAQVEGQEVVKVLDFGIAKVVRGDRRIDALETQAGTVFGTPRYMSPEQAQSKQLDARSDLYSLGVIFYQMLTGHAPFEDSDAVVVMARHIKTKPRRPSDVRPDLNIPPRLEKLVLRLMEKDRNKRPQSSEELIEALTKWSPGNDDDLAFIAGGSASMNRRLIPVAIAAGISFLLAAGAVIAFAVTRDTDRAEADARVIQEQARLIAAADDEEVTSELDASVVDPVPAKIAVTIESEPPGATVVRDGEELGATPLVLNELPGAEVTLELSLEGFLSKIETLTMSEEQSSHRFELVSKRPAKGRPVAGWRGRPHRGKQPAKTPSEEPTKSTETPQKRPSRYGMFDRR